MLSIKVNGKYYNIPESWEDVTIRKQIEVTQFKRLDESFRNIHMISTYTGIPFDLVKKMNINQFNEILGLMQFLAKAPEGKIIGSFAHNNKTYYLADSLLAGETQDFLSIEGLLKRYNDNQTEALPYIIAIVAKQNGETLDNYDPMKRGEEFMDLPYSVAHDVWFFFGQTRIALQSSTEQYLMAQDRAMEASLSYSETILKRSDGQGLYRKLLRTYLLQYIKYTRKSWASFLTTTQLESSNRNLKAESKKNK